MTPKEAYNEALSDVAHLIKKIFYLKGANFPIVNVDMMLEFEKNLSKMKFTQLTEVKKNG